MAATDDIAKLLKTYEQAMVASDPDLAASCWTTDGVLIPAMLPTATGPAIHDTYVRTFAAVRLDFTFTIDEIVVINDTFTYARTRSKGTQTILASSVETSGSNRELYLFRNDSGSWRIARYMFNQAA
jgi:ketosteroid isomerase-like protein